MCVSIYDHEYFLKGVEDFLSFHSIGDDRFFSVGAAIDYIFSVSLCYDYYEYSGGAEAYFIENIESIHMHKRDTEKVKYTKTRLRCYTRRHHLRVVCVYVDQACFYCVT